MSNELAMTEQTLSVLEKLVIGGDLSVLTPDQRVSYYRLYCESVGLDWQTQPFSYIKLSGKLVLYATKGATEQLCEKRKLSVELVSEGLVDGDLYRAHGRAISEDKRFSDNIGVVSVASLKGEALANAMMKAVTKSFRRAVLAHCGLGKLDETETETIPNAVPVPVESAHQPVAQTIELATPADVAKYEAIRQTAADFGFRINGNEPSHVTVDTPRDRVLKGITIMQKWLDGNTPSEAETTQSPSTPTLCDPDQYQKKYFAIAKDTKYAGAQDRADFIRTFTNGKTGSLSTALETMTIIDAQRMCRELQNRITAEAGNYDESDPFADEDEDGKLPLETAAATNTAHA